MREMKDYADGWDAYCRANDRARREEIDNETRELNDELEEIDEDNYEDDIFDNYKDNRRYILNKIEELEEELDTLF